MLSLVNVGNWRVSIAVLALLISHSSFSNEISSEKKILIDEVWFAQGARMFDVQVAELMTEELKSGFDEMGFKPGEDFYQIFSEVIQEVVLQEFLISGEMQELNYKVWGERFTSEELQRIHSFYKTPTGEKLAAELPEINKRVMKHLQKLFEESAPLITHHLQQRLLQEGFDLDLTEFMPDAQQPIPQVEKITRRELRALIQETCVADDDPNNRTPVFRAPPIYPYNAREFRVEGWVDLKYTILADGSTQEIKVTNASTGTLFDEAAIEAAKLHQYCPSHTESHKALRIRFEMESAAAQKSNIHEVLEESDHQFANSERFNEDLKDYQTRTARKALAIADDGGDYWTIGWAANYRLQSAANANALQECRKHRRREQLENACRLLLIGNELALGYQNNDAVQGITTTIKDEAYEPLSEYERLLEEYSHKPQPKALALVVNPDDAYYLYYAVNESSQETANSIALNNCNEQKDSSFEHDCELYMVGDHRSANAPSLKSLKGVWQGAMEQNKSVVINEADTNYSSMVMLDNCGEFPKIYRKNEEDKEYTPFRRLFEVIERSGNAVLTSVEDGGSWVETQVWTFIELNDNEAVMQWNRAVSNVDLELDEENREFRMLGVGRLKKVQDGCEQERRVK